MNAPKPDGVAEVEGVLAAGSPNATITLPASWLKELLAYLRAVEEALARSG